MADDNIGNAVNCNTKFNIELVYDSLLECCKDMNAIDMDHYLTSFRELYKFFGLLGSVFGFVASDIISKVTILEKYRNSESAESYKTLQVMLEYESTNGILKDTSQPSGCRTLLRLNWALEFIMLFMKRMSSAAPDAKSACIARDCYKESLGKHHSWWIQQGANIAMYSLPVRQQFFEKVLGPCDQGTISNSEKLMNDIADICSKLFKETEKLYQNYDLLNLA